MDGKVYIGYEYIEVLVDEDKASLCMDAYGRFGWVCDDTVRPTLPVRIHNQSVARNINKVSIRLKRDRKIINKAELTRLQRNFEACLNEIEKLERSAFTAATIPSVLVGILGTAFLAGSTFAITADSPMVLLCILLAIPGFAGWILPCYVYKSVLKRKTEETRDLIEQKYDEIHDLCEKGNNLL